MSYSDSLLERGFWAWGYGSKAAVYWVVGARTPHVCDVSRYTCLFSAETSSSDCKRLDVLRDTGGVRSSTARSSTLACWNPEHLYETRHRGRAKLGEEHPQTLTSMNNLASLLQAAGGPFPSFRPKGAIMREVLRRVVEHNEAQRSEPGLAGGVSSFLTHTPALTAGVTSGRIGAAMRKPSRCSGRHWRSATASGSLWRKICES